MLEAEILLDPPISIIAVSRTSSRICLIGFLTTNQDIELQMGQPMSFWSQRFKDSVNQALE